MPDAIDDLKRERMMRNLMDAKEMLTGKSEPTRADIEYIRRLLEFIDKTEMDLWLMT